MQLGAHHINMGPTHLTPLQIARITNQRTRLSDWKKLNLLRASTAALTSYRRRDNGLLSAFLKITDWKNNRSLLDFRSNLGVDCVIEVSFMDFARRTRRSVCFCLTLMSLFYSREEHINSQSDCLRNLLVCMILTTSKSDC